MRHIKKPIFIVLGGLLLIGLLLWAWRAWLAPTRIAFVNYQITALGQIAKSNDSRFIKIREVGLDELKRLRRADMVFVNGMGLRLTAEQREQLEDISFSVPMLTTAATNPDNYADAVAILKNRYKGADDMKTPVWWSKYRVDNNL